MAHWLLQANPAHWRVSDFFGDGRTGTVWTIRRHRDRMAPDDDVVLWLSGRAGGVVALGRVTGEPFHGTASWDDEQYWTAGHAREKARWLVPVEFTTSFVDRPITRADLKADKRFTDSLILRVPRGANPFPVEPEEWPAITERLPHAGDHAMVATTVRGAAAIVAGGATAVREAVRSLMNLRSPAAPEWCGAERPGCPRSGRG